MFFSYLDGRHWHWTLAEEIYENRSRVNVRKHGKNVNITFHMKKKVQQQWDSLEVNLS